MISNNFNGKNLQTISSLSHIKQNDNLDFRDNLRSINPEVLCFLLAFRIEILEKQLDNFKLDMKISIDLQNKYKCQFQHLKSENKKLMKQLQNQLKEQKSQILNKDKLISELNIKLQNIESQKQFIQQQYQDDLENQENLIKQKWKSCEDKLQKQFLDYQLQLDQAELDYKTQQQSYEENIQLIIHSHSQERQDQLIKQEMLEQQLIKSKSKYQNEIIQLNNQMEQQAKKLLIIPLYEQEIKKLNRSIKQFEQRISELQIYIQKQAYQFQDNLKIKDKEISNEQQRIKTMEGIKTQLENEKLQLNKENLILFNENKQQLVLINSIQDQLKQFEIQVEEFNILSVEKSNHLEQLQQQLKQLQISQSQAITQISLLHNELEQNSKSNLIQRQNKQKFYSRFNPLYAIIYKQFKCRISYGKTITKNQEQ
ncbi:hypothetical protein pb186bvf_019696 [Paramecium bursaria]